MYQPVAAWKPRVWAKCNQSMSKASLQGSAPPATAARPRPFFAETILNILRDLLHTMYIELLEAGNLAICWPGLFPKAAAEFALGFWVHLNMNQESISSLGRF